MTINQYKTLLPKRQLSEWLYLHLNQITLRVCSTLSTKDSRAASLIRRSWEADRTAHGDILNPGPLETEQLGLFISSDLPAITQKFPELQYVESWKSPSPAREYALRAYWNALKGATTREANKAKYRAARKHDLSAALLNVPTTEDYMINEQELFLRLHIYERDYADTLNSKDLAVWNTMGRYYWSNRTRDTAAKLLNCSVATAYRKQNALADAYMTYAKARALSEGLVAEYNDSPVPSIASEDLESLSVVGAV